ncbi:MAG: HPP family protein [Pseudomonadota bacterium]
MIILKVMLNLIKKNFKQALLAFVFSGITIGSLSFLSLNTPYGLFVVGSFGATMVLVFGYPESPFSQPKNIFFGHFTTSLVGILILQFLPIDQFLQIAIAVGLAIFVMILLGVTHPPAGGNPILIILGTSSYSFLLNPIIYGSIIIIIYAVILNRVVLKKNYPNSWKSSI